MVGLTTCAKNNDRYNVLCMAFCFLGLFSAFQPVQSLQTSSQGSAGFIGLGLLYGSLAFGAMVSATVVRAVGQKWGLILVRRLPIR
jgi:hypothetical protein